MNGKITGNGLTRRAELYGGHIIRNLHPPHPAALLLVHPAKEETHLTGCGRPARSRSCARALLHNGRLFVTPSRNVISEFSEPQCVAWFCTALKHECSVPSPAVVLLPCIHRRHHLCSEVNGIKVLLTSPGPELSLLVVEVSSGVAQQVSRHTPLVRWFVRGNRGALLKFERRWRSAEHRHRLVPGICRFGGEC